VGKYSGIIYDRGGGQPLFLRHFMKNFTFVLLFSLFAVSPMALTMLLRNF